MFRYNAVKFLKNIRHNAVKFLKKYSQKMPHSSPIRVSYGVSFVDPASAWVPAIIYAISYYTGPHYNGTRLYEVPYMYQLMYQSMQMTWECVIIWSVFSKIFITGMPKLYSKTFW